MKRSWRSIAIELGRRMEYHAHQCSEEHDDDHPPQDCPFCDDTAAYEAYVKRLDQET